MKNSIPAGLPINEQSRLLAYLKVKFHNGFFFKSDMSRIARVFCKDLRTFKRLLQSLKTDMLIGEDEKAFYLRSWRFITGLKNFNQQSFECSLEQLNKKERFEVILFAAKLTSINKAIRRGAKVRSKGKLTDQIAVPTGFLAKACHVSPGKVTRLKRKASIMGLITVNKSFEDYGPGTAQSAGIAKREDHGIFLKNGRLLKRRPDQIESAIPTYRIKNRKSKKITKQQIVMRQGRYSRRQNTGESKLIYPMERTPPGVGSKSFQSP